MWRKLAGATIREKHEAAPTISVALKTERRKGGTPEWERGSPPAGWRTPKGNAVPRPWILRRLCTLTQSRAVSGLLDDPGADAEGVGHDGYHGV